MTNREEDLLAQQLYVSIYPMMYNWHHEEGADLPAIRTMAEAKYAARKFRELLKEQAEGNGEKYITVEPPAPLPKPRIIGEAPIDYPPPQGKPLMEVLIAENTTEQQKAVEWLNEPAPQPKRRGRPKKTIVPAIATAVITKEI